MEKDRIHLSVGAACGGDVTASPTLLNYYVHSARPFELIFTSATTEKARSGQLTSEQLIEHIRMHSRRVHGTHHEQVPVWVV